jgi:uncharacterized membrane protein YjgN (DUF898 family)
MSETPATAASAQTRPVLVYDGDIGDLFGVYLMNLLLTIITFGIFRFWAITRMRRYLWSHMSFEGTRFTYTGKGRELFFGFVLAMLVLILLIAGIAGISVLLAQTHPVLAFVPVVLAYIGMFILFGAAHFSAQRYRLSRTEWRGIRGGMQGSALRYGVNWVLYVVLVGLTLYQAVPWMQIGLARWRINASRFGSAVFHCDARGRSLYLTWLATFAGYLVALGLIGAVVAMIEWSSLGPVFAGSIKGPAAEIAYKHAIPAIIIGILIFTLAAGQIATWYYARLLRLVLSHTTAVIPATYGEDIMHFSSTVKAGGLFWLVLSNLLIALFTFGFGVPIVLHRYAKYVARTTQMTGTFDANALVQSTLSRPTLGEGFLQALDPGIF